MIKHLSLQHMRPCLLVVAGLLLALTGCATTAVGPTGADAAYQRGDWRGAEEGYEAYLAARPEDVEAWFRLGNARAEQARLIAAEAAYRRVLDLRPEHHRARHNLGLVLLQQGVTALLEARRGLPEADAEAARTMRYLACLMETFMGHPEPGLCRQAAEQP